MYESCGLKRIALIKKDGDIVEAHGTDGGEIIVVLHGTLEDGSTVSIRCDADGYLLTKSES